MYGEEAIASLRFTRREGNRKGKMESTVVILSIQGTLLREDSADSQTDTFV